MMKPKTTPQGELPRWGEGLGGAVFSALAASATACCCRDSSACLIRSSSTFATASLASLSMVAMDFPALFSNSLTVISALRQNGHFPERVELTSG